jgi:hypothetical protein
MPLTATRKRPSGGAADRRLHGAHRTGSSEIQSTPSIYQPARNGANLMTTRRAACSCGQLHLIAEGEPSRVWVCHCLECQRRTGAVIGNQARFHREQITFNGTATAWRRTGASGNSLTCYFCPICGSTIHFESEAFPGIVAVAIGNFADPNFPAPIVSVWEETRHPWLSLSPDTKRMAQQG